jgi:hypothetical protein
MRSGFAIKKGCFWVRISGLQYRNRFHFILSRL